MSIFSPIATALSPNTERDDILLAFKLLLPTNWNKWQKGDEIEQLENEFKKYLDVKHAISFSSGRVGLYAILSVIASKSERDEDLYGNPVLIARKTGLSARGGSASGMTSSSFDSFRSLRTPRNDKGGNLQEEIIIQAYTTIAVPNAIIWAGFKPIYVDIKENTYNIDPGKIEEKITPQTKAIIVQHTFGIPAEMDKILAICKKYNLFLIEDCAHSLGAEYDSRKVGTFGEVAFFSFGRDKIISSVSGGMAITNNEQLAGKLKEFRDSLPYSSQKFIFTQLLHPVAFAIILPTYYFFNFGQGLLWLLQKLRLLTRAYSQEEKKGIMPQNFPRRLNNALAMLALNQFRKLEKFNAHRQKIAKIYQDYFTQKQYGNMNYHTKLKTNEFYENSSYYDNTYYHSVKFPLISSDSWPTFLYYTIQIKNRDLVLEYAKKNHIILGDWFPGALGPKGVEIEKSRNEFGTSFGYKKGDCPMAEKVGNESLNLPTNIKTSQEDAKRIGNLIKEFLHKK